MEDSKPVCTPIITGCSLSSNDESPIVNQPKYRGRFQMVTRWSLSSNDESPIMNQLEYISLIGRLLYLTGTRQDIMHAVGNVGRFQANLKKSHLQEVKRIFKYLQATQDFDLWYPKYTYLTLHAYTDVDWAGNLDDRQTLVEVHFIWDHN